MCRTNQAQSAFESRIEAPNRLLDEARLKGMKDMLERKAKPNGNSCEIWFPLEILRIAKILDVNFCDGKPGQGIRQRVFLGSVSQNARLSPFSASDTFQTLTRSAYPTRGGRKLFKNSL